MPLLFMLMLMLTFSDSRFESTQIAVLHLIRSFEQSNGPVQAQITDTTKRNKQ